MNIAVRVWLLVAAATGLAACAVQVPAPAASLENSPAILAALDRQQDGYRGVIPGSGIPFRIVSTAASSTELCRVVEIRPPERFLVESYCKAPGGRWR